jgi:glutamate-1-semialdehyde 2,1-aminomutase
MRQMEEIFFSFTFGGEALSLAAAKATLQKLQREPVAQTLAARGQAIIDGSRAIVQAHGLEDIFSLSGHPTWSFLNIKDARGATAFEIKTLWMQEIIERGILSVGTHNVNYAHSETDIAQLLNVYADVLPFIGKVLSDGKLSDALRCKPLVPLFKLR